MVIVPARGRPPFGATLYLMVLPSRVTVMKSSLLLALQRQHCVTRIVPVPPREVTWISGVLLLLVIFAFALTGYLLPWDQRAYWATVVTLMVS